VQKLADAPAVEELEVPVPVYRSEDDPTQFVISREDDASWRVTGVAIERSASMTYWEHDGSLRRFQKLMEKLGLDEALRKAGVEEGDTVHIGDFELEWQE
jgi:GTP-binding protein